MIRHGDYKLIIPKSSKTKCRDMLFNLRADPLEQRNLLGDQNNVSKLSIGKAEHLKILLREFMRR